MRSVSHALVIAVVVATATLSAAACGGGGDDDGPNFQDDHPRIYLPRNRDRLVAMVAANTEAWQRFKNIVDIQVSGEQNIYAFEAWYAALVSQVTDDTSYCDYAVGMIDDIVRDEESKISAGQRADVAGDSYLEVGPRIGDLALTYDWCFDQASASQKSRWVKYANQAVWNVWHPEEANWGGTVFEWSGWSIDNPSNNYYYSFLRATMTLGIATRGETDEGQQWIDMFRNAKIRDQLVPTFERDLTGGGSREGTGYGVAMKNLWELYDVWEGSTGENIADDTGHARASMLHLMHSTVPTLDRVAPIGDHARDASAAWFDYHRQYLAELIYLFKDDPIAPYAKQMLADSSVPEMDQPFMYVYDFLYDSDVTPASLDGLGKAYFAPGNGDLFARSGWNEGATWMSFKAGPYSESHAHQDQGSFMIYKGGWLGYDGVVDSTSGLTQEPEAHSLIRFVSGGATVSMQEPTESMMVALARGNGWLYAAGDLTPAFDGNAAVTRWQREIVFIEPDVFVIYDRADSASGAQQVWQLVSPAAFTVNGASASVMGTGHRLTAQRILPASATGTSSGLQGDFRGGFRYDETSAGGSVRHLHVLSIDGAVTAATSSPGSTQDGVQLTLADGRTATVRFNSGAIGGTLQVSAGGGAPAIDETLAAGVQSLPERN
jgi:hypothetical protein